MSDSMSIMQDNVYLISGNNTRIRQEGDSIIISAADAGETSLDDAYNAGGPGEGRKINANDGSVWITGKDGLELYGTEQVLKASAHEDIPVGQFWSFGLGNAIEAEVSSDKNQRAAVLAVSMGDSASAAISAEVPVGKATAGRFIIEDASNQNNVMDIVHQGEGNGLDVNVSGEKSVGVFIESTNDLNQQNALKAKMAGIGDAILGIVKDAATHQQGHLFKAGVVGSSIDVFGVYGVSDNKSGVLGRTKSAGDFDLGPDSIKAGVLGLSNSQLVGSADNWGVAGIGSRYGSGVLGIAGPSGHGVVGISAGSLTRTSGAIRGITIENPITDAWPPFFPLDEFPGGKRDVGVLGQTYTNTGVWGEAIEGIGVVGTVGKRTDWNDVSSYANRRGRCVIYIKRTAIMGIADSNHAGRFTSGREFNDYSSLRAESYQYAGAFEAISMGPMGNAGNFRITNQNNDSAAVLINNRGKGEALSVWATGSGRAAHLRTMDAQNDAITLKVSNYGKNDAAYILIPNQTNNRVALYAETYGLGNAAVLRSMNANSQQTAVMIENYGAGVATQIRNHLTTNNTSALLATTNGSGRSAEFFTTNLNNSAATLYSGNLGVGKAAEFICSNTNSTSTVLTLYHSGRGKGMDINLANAANTASGIVLTQAGTGRSIEYNITNGSNNSIGLYGATIGPGTLAYFIRNHTTSSNTAVHIQSNSSAYTLYAGNTTTAPNNNAAYFAGRVVVTSILSKGGGSFKIDHPLESG
jgi:hypothetical protein